MGGFAWVTLATNDSYSLGALVLAHSLKRVGTKHDLAVLITPGVTDVMRQKLSSVFSLVQEVNVLDSKDEANLALLARPELGITFTKLHCWRLTQYEKCVFVDADALVVQNCDELFERQELSAAPDVGWPDCFNSGVFVFQPSQQTFASLTAFATSKGSFDGGDQGLLNSFFSDWAHKDISKHLPFIYNMCSTATYSYLPAYKQFGEDVRIIHFIGGTKPWLQYFDTLTGQVQAAQGTGHLQPLLQHWWNIFCENVHPELSPVMASSTLAPHWHNYPLPSSLKPTSTRHVCHDATDMTFDEVDTIPDFSEFQDPWEHYIEATNDTQSVHSSQQIHHSNSSEVEKKEEQLVTDKSSQNFDQLSQTIQNFSISKDHHNHHNHANNVPINYHHQTDFPTSSNHGQKDQHSSSHSQVQHFQHHHLKHLEHFDNPPNVQHVQYSRQQNHDHNQVFEASDEGDESSHQLNMKSSESLENAFCRNDRTTGMAEIDHNLTDEIPFSKSMPRSHSQPCTESNIDGSQTDTHIINEIEKNAGIAGALAKITLGEARSPEQVALEEHMRKYGWEQGKIDYMGVDSFDNIWKKISTTLEISPVETKSENTPTEKKSPPSEKEKLLTLEKPVDEITKAETKVDEDSTEHPLRQKQDTSFESQEDKIKQQAQATSPTVLALKAAPSVLSIKQSGEKPQDVFVYQPISRPEDDEPSTPTPGSVIPLGFTASPTFEATTSFNLATGEQETETTDDVSSAPERPAPIQRALSIVEADIKESVTENIRPATGEIISSISASPQNPISAVFVRPPTAIETSIPSQPNGDVEHEYDGESSQDEIPLQPVARSSIYPERVTPNAAPTTPTEGATTQLSNLEKVPEIPVEETRESVPEVSAEVPEIVAEVKPTVEETPEVPVSTEGTSGAQFGNLKFTSDVTESKVQVPEVEGKGEEPEIPEQVPVKPVRTKDIKIPATPTVTEATPPTSPQFETTEDETKEPTKVVEKPETDDKPEPKEKKTTKKVVKKVTKNPKDEASGSSISEKGKKVGKVVGESAESGQNLEPDNSVPETPPPASSGIPVPPKRKTKPSTMKTSTRDPPLDK